MKLFELMLISRDYTHVCIRSYENSERYAHGIGGGCPKDMALRYPNLEVESLFVSDNILYVTCKNVI